MTTAGNPAILSEVFRALSDPIRRGMLARLAIGPCSVSELSQPYTVTAPAITKHLGVLQRSGLIVRWKNGRTNYCRLIPRPLEAVSDWIEVHREFWERQFGQLEDFFRTEQDQWKVKPDGKTKQPSGSLTSLQPHQALSSKRGRPRKC